MAGKKSGEVVDLTAQLLREIRDGQREGMDALRKEMHAGFERVDRRMDAMAQHMALVSKSLMVLANQSDSAIEDLRRRVERLEKRG